MNTKLKLVIGGAATFLIVGGATAAGLAYANPGSPSPAPTTPSASSSPQGQPSPGADKQKKNKQGKGEKGEKLLGRALHGEATVKGGKQAGGTTMVIVFQRGTVTAVSATSVTVKSEDGYSATYAINGDVRVRSGKDVGSLADVKTDARVRLAAVKDGQTSTTKRIILVP